MPARFLSHGRSSHLKSFHLRRREAKPRARAVGLLPGTGETAPASRTPLGRRNRFLGRLFPTCPGVPRLATRPAIVTDHQNWHRVGFRCRLTHASGTESIESYLQVPGDFTRDFNTPPPGQLIVRGRKSPVHPCLPAWRRSEQCRCGSGTSGYRSPYSSSTASITLKVACHP